MSQTLTYTIINAQLVSVECAVEIDGEPAVARSTRLVVEAQPDDRLGRTLTAVLPASAVDEFAEGSAVTITITAAPVAQAQEA